MADGRQTCELDLDGVRWIALGDPSDARALADLPRKLPCKILRYTPRRRVLYAAGPPALLIKQYFHGGWIQLAKNLLRGAPARREWRALRAAERRGLPVPKALALASARPVRESWLVTEFVAPAVSLEDLLRGELETQRKRLILRRAALLIRAMHDAGFYPRDLHLGNLLVRRHDQEPELWLLDLQRIDIDPWSPLAKRWRDLAALHGGGEGASRSDRLRFLKVYLSVAPALGLDERRLITKLDRAGGRRRFHVWRSRQKRCLAENREFTAVRIGTWNGFARLSEWSDELKAALAEPGGLLARADIVKDSRTTTVGRAAFGALDLFVKRYNYQGAAYAIKDLFRSSRAKRGWQSANNCHMRGIDVALPVAYLERRRWRVLRESYVVTAAVPGEELSRLLARRGGNIHLKRELIGQLARRLRWIHDRGLAPRDLKGANLIAEERDPGRYKFSIVDFDGIASAPMSWRARARNLARLVRATAANVPITATDRLRFVKNYLGPGKFPRRRKLYRAVTKFAARA